MFRKPLGGIKTSAPLRSSDRRKLKQRVVDTFHISPEDGDLIVPEGILSIKLSTHLNERGVAYLAPNGDPLWFTIGKESDDLIPTVYTLWKQRNLLPFVSTPPEVIPTLVGGADLMISGVVHRSPSLGEGQLVSISQYNHHDKKPTLSLPLAVGRMAPSSDQLPDRGKDKKKAVHILHSWKDHLWDIGSKPNTPEATAMKHALNDKNKKETSNKHIMNTPRPKSPRKSLKESLQSVISYTPEETTELLHISLLQAIATSLSSLPNSSFPITSTIFYTNYILPARPAFPIAILFPSQSHDDDVVDINPQDITIKSSTHKSLTAFLKSAEKALLLTLKTPQKHIQQFDLLITSVDASHPSVTGHKSYLAVKDLEARAAEEEEPQAKNEEIEIVEMWKPHEDSVALFEGLKASVAALYTFQEIESLLDAYFITNSLVNASNKGYINLDALLLSCVSSTKTKAKATEKEVKVKAPVLGLQSMKRYELTNQVMHKMQRWHEVRVKGKDPICKKGRLGPMHVLTKILQGQGRKAITLITGFEAFHVVEAEEMAEDLKKICACATSVSGEHANSGLQVLVQGRQTTAVTKYLVGKGIPRKWIK